MLRRLVPSLALASLATLALSGCVPRNPPMPEKWAVPAKPNHSPRALPEPTFDGKGEEGSLLASYASRKSTTPDKRADWTLPTNAKTLIVELLIAAAHDDAVGVKALMTPGARFGLPDRGELLARAIYQHDDLLGLEFLTQFREVTSRLGKRASFNCRPMQPGWELLVAGGAEPMWCTYTSADGFDLLVFRLVTEGGEARVDYVGYMPERPTGYVRVANIGDRPPTTPFIKTAPLLEAPPLMPDASSPVVEEPARPVPPSQPSPPPAEPAPADVEKPAEGDKAEKADDKAEKPAKPEKPEKPEGNEKPENEGKGDEKKAE